MFPTNIKTWFHTLHHTFVKTIKRTLENHLKEVSIFPQEYILGTLHKLISTKREIGCVFDDASINIYLSMSVYEKFSVCSQNSSSTFMHHASVHESTVFL